LPFRGFDLNGFDADGREVLHLPGATFGSTCRRVHSGPRNLLFNEGVDSVHGQSALWSFLLLP
jgi:hypothetical protein